MIAQLRGEIVDKLTNSIVVDVNGIGYEVLVSTLDYDQLLENETIKLYTYLAVRENAQDLYGFTSQSAKQLFSLLIGVNGVGPKVALSILSLGEPSHIKNAIASKNVAFVQSASGVGKKGAEKIILDLKDKVSATGDESPLLDDLVTDDDAHAALVSLGYSSAQSYQVLAKLDDKLDTEQRIKQALKELSK
jgi:Holliday junction DNA helicase RuvA